MESRVVGLCEVSEVGRPNSEVCHRALLGLAVSREHRGRGVGRALLREMLRRCRKKFEIIELPVLSKNEVARKLYARLGFRSFGVIPRAVKRESLF